MQTLFSTLHGFMLHTKSITYLLVGGLLVGILLFWCFLTGRDDQDRHV